MTLLPDGISAVSRLADWNEYTLFKAYADGKITCVGESKSAQKFCGSLDLM